MNKKKIENLLISRKYQYFCVDLIQNMTEKHEKLLADLDFRLQQLIYLCDSLKEENQNLKIKLNEKESEVQNAKAGLEELSRKYSNLKFANTMTGADNESVEKAKFRLSKLVQEVDKCIALLKI